ncbi:MAG: 6-pyruvoyl trahydropterin synthase family protein [Gemmatimonadota bacterium]
MARTFLTRRVTFAAAHRYRRPDWDDERNGAVFGACSNRNYHGHTWVCDVTVTGPVDRETGMLIDLAWLDRVLGAEVTDRLDHRNINLEVAEFADGGLIPTGENLAAWIFERVQAALGDRAIVEEVRVAEDDRLSSTCRREPAGRER